MLTADLFPPTGQMRWRPCRASTPSRKPWSASSRPTSPARFCTWDRRGTSPSGTETSTTSRPSYSAGTTPCCRSSSPPTPGTFSLSVRPSVGNQIWKTLTSFLCPVPRKCKEDFAHSLDGIKTVTGNFLNKINNLFPHQLTFHLTCERQRDEMEKIRTSCTNLSKEVENKFQVYLDKVGDKVGVAQFSLLLSDADVNVLTVLGCC